MTEFVPTISPEAIKKSPVQILANWLSRADAYASKSNGPFGSEASRMQLQRLTDKPVDHPLSHASGQELELNVQLAAIVLNELKNTEHFAEGTAEKLIESIERGLATGQWEAVMSPTAAMIF